MKRIILMSVILVILAVGTASGYVYDFTDSSDWSDFEQYSGYTMASLETNATTGMKYVEGFSTAVDPADVYFRHKISYPTNYWAYALFRHEGTLTPGDFFDVDKSGIGGSSATHPDGDDWHWTFVEIKREDGQYFKLYYDGVFQEYVLNSTTVPYYWGIQGDGGQYDLRGFYIDHVIIGTNEDHYSIDTMPSGWFIAKDFIDPGFTGFYSTPGTQVSATTFYASYATEDGGGTLIMKNVATGEIVNTTTFTDYCNQISYNITEIFITPGVDYGLYSIEIFGTDAICYFDYRGVATTGTDIAWNNTTYTEDETATISYNISSTYWVTDDYRYYRKILAPDLSVIESTELTERPVSSTYNVDIDVDTFPISGIYYCTLYAQDRSSGEDILLVYDNAEVTVTWGGANGVDIEGTTYDATTGDDLGSCTVTATQLGVPHPTTSNPTDGSYEIDGLDLAFSIGMNASKTSYVGYPVYFTPYEEGTYTVDLPLVPAGGAYPGDWYDVTGGRMTVDSSAAGVTAYYNATTDGTGCGGIVYNEPYWTATTGSTVTISNATWNATQTTSAGGWWQFNETTDGVCGGTYTVTCSKSGYTTCSGSIVLPEDEFTRKDCCLGTSFTLTVLCRELTSNALITDADVYVELDTGDSTTCSNGTCSFSGVEYGVVGITCSALGYYPGTQSVVVDSDTTATCYLQAEPDYGDVQPATNNTGFGVSYAPKTVRFTVQTIWGKPIEDCNVTCQGYETTAGSWDWLYKLFGVNQTETPIATTSMTGLTDYKGDINFIMLEPVQYQCTFVKAGECNETLTIYPKDDYYQVIAGGFGNTSWFEGGQDINEAITCNVTKGDDGSTGWVQCAYTDLSGGTTGGTCYLNQSNPADPENETVIDSYVIATNNFTANFTSLPINGQSYHLHVEPTHSTWDFERSYVVNFPKEKVNPMNLSDTELMLFASFLILFCGLLFGAISAPHAPLVMSFLGWIFLALGWLDAVLLTATASLTLATVLSVLVLVMVRSKKERFV